MSAVSVADRLEELATELPMGHAWLQYDMRYAARRIRKEEGVEVSPDAFALYYEIAPKPRHGESS